jgi:glycosyltransferase involved in cell wall biosynthesis
MTSVPKISIITPSFNQSEFLDKCILSVVGQHYPALEYIVIDGGSTDNSIQVINKYSDKIFYHVSERDNGHGDGLNKGFAVSSGEIMGWVNSDDMLTPWSLNCISEVFTLFPHVHWIQGFASFWNKRGQMTSAKRNPKNIYDYLIGNHAWIQQESVFWRRSLWEKAGGRISDKARFMVDGELWGRFFKYESLYTVDCVLGGWRNSGVNRAIANRHECIAEMESVIRKLRSECTQTVLATAKKLKTAARITDSALTRKAGLSRLVWKVLGRTYLRSDLELAFYKAIVWDYNDHSWKETRIPFRSYE